MQLGEMGDRPLDARLEKKVAFKTQWGLVVSVGLVIH